MQNEYQCTFTEFYFITMQRKITIAFTQKQNIIMSTDFSFVRRFGGVCEFTFLVEMYLPFIPESESTPAKHGEDEVSLLQLFY
jgi:hypothetical protein